MNKKSIFLFFFLLVGYQNHAIASGGSCVNPSGGNTLGLSCSNGQVPEWNGAGFTECLSAGGSGTVTSMSIVSGNGFAGTVASPTTTPAVTLSTSITGVLKGNGTAISAATAGTDYSAGTAANATGIVKSTTTTGALTTAIAADFPTLNQNTSGTAASFTGNLTGDVTSTGMATVLAATTNATLTTLSALTSVGALATGSLASGFTKVTVPLGGSGIATATAHGVLLGEGASPFGFTAAGTTGQVLTGVTGSDPTWQAAAGGLAIGGAVSGGTATRVLYEGTGPVLADSSDWVVSGFGTATQTETFGDTGTATLTIRTNQSGTRILNRNYIGAQYWDAGDINATSWKLTYNGAVGLSMDTSSSIAMPSLASSSSATTGTVCWTTGTGNLTVDTTLACLASIRKIKENVTPLASGLKTVMALKPISYNLKPEYNPMKLGQQVGFVAEDVQAVDERLVGRDAKGELAGVRYMQMTAVLTKAIQEMKLEIDQLKARTCD